MTANQHYIKCQDENCERLTCVSRRDYESKIARLEIRLKKVQILAEKIKSRNDCICHGKRRCLFHAMLES